jgi:hypothetical protein
MTITRYDHVSRARAIAADAAERWLEGGSDCALFVTRAGGGAVSSAYDPGGRLSSAYDPGGRLTTTCRACLGHGVTWHHDQRGGIWCTTCPWCLGTGRWAQTPGTTGAQPGASPGTGYHTFNQETTP